MHHSGLYITGSGQERPPGLLASQIHPSVVPRSAPAKPDLLGLEPGGGSEVGRRSPVLHSVLHSDTSSFLLKDDPRIRMRLPQGFPHGCLSVVAQELHPQGEFCLFWFLRNNEVRSPAMGFLVHFSGLYFPPSLGRTGRPKLSAISVI